MAWWWWWWLVGVVPGVPALTPCARHACLLLFVCVRVCVCVCVCVCCRYATGDAVWDEDIGDFLTLDFNIVGDGLFHTYYIPLYGFREPIPVVQTPITQLRLLPAINAALGQSIAIDFIRIAEGVWLRDDPVPAAAVRTTSIVCSSCVVWCVVCGSADDSGGGGL